MPLLCLWHMIFGDNLFSFLCPHIRERHVFTRSFCPTLRGCRELALRVRHPLSGLITYLGGVARGLKSITNQLLSLFSFASLCPGSLGKSNLTQQSSLLYQVSDHLKSRSVTSPPSPLPVFFSTCPCHSLSLGIPPSSPVFPPTHLKSLLGRR